MEKVKNSLGQITSNENMLSHLIDEIILFDNELHSIFDYPIRFPSCTSVLTTQPYLDRWICLEEKRRFHRFYLCSFPNCFLTIISIIIAHILQNILYFYLTWYYGL